MAEKESKVDDKGIAPACKGCVRWDKFGKNCHYFWEAKKECSMYATTVEEL